MAVAEPLSEVQPGQVSAERAERGVADGGAEPRAGTQQSRHLFKPPTAGDMHVICFEEKGRVRTQNLPARTPARGESKL